MSKSILDKLTEDPKAKRNNEVDRENIKTPIEKSIEKIPVKNVKPVKKKQTSEPKKIKLDIEDSTQARISNNINQVLLLIKKHYKLSSINDVVYMFVKDFKSGEKSLDQYIEHLLSNEN